MSSFTPQSDLEVLNAVRSLAAKNKIAFTRHAEERMQLRGIDRSTVKKCLTKGNFAEPPTIPNGIGEIEYIFKMHAKIDGDSVEVVAKLLPNTCAIVITVIDPKN